MNNIIVTLFEKQIIRNYLSDNAQFLENLSKNHRLIIFSDSKNSPIFSELFNKIQSDRIKLVELENFEYSTVFRTCSSILKWSNKSSTIFREIMSRYEGSKKAKVVTPIRILIYFLLKKSDRVERILRFIILKTFDTKKFESHLGSQITGLNLAQSKSILVTSLTNAKDIHVALFAKKMNIKIIGTVRSWDNLSSHGRLVVEPNIFYSHSDFMSDTLLEFHSLKECKVDTLVAPNYKKSFIPEKTESLKNKSFNIGYACMGARVNPDDYNFTNEFNNLAKFFPEQTFYIIQHPAYPHKIEFSLNQNVRVVQYDYNKSGLESFYRNLSTFDLIIGGGTSLLLDAAILEIPVIFIGFEYQKHSYWTSALRYMDYVYHFNKFIEKTDIFICRSHSELVRVIRSGDFSHYRSNARSISYFSGNTNLDLNAKLTELIC